MIRDAVRARWMSWTALIALLVARVVVPSIVGVGGQ